MAEAPTAPEDKGVFTAVRLVISRTCPAMPSMPHVIHAISSCLDDRTLETATKIGSTLLLDRFAAREWPEAGEAFREARFLQNVEIAASEGHVNALNWWRTKYLPNHHPVCCYEEPPARAAVAA